MNKSTPPLWPRLGSVLLAASLLLSTNAHGDPVVPARAKAGARVAWLAIAHTRVHEHLESQQTAGIAVAAADGNIGITPPAAGARRLVVSIIDLDEGTAGRAVPETLPHPEERLLIAATAGQSSVVIEAGEIYIVYARKRGHAWTRHAHDGGSRDADGMSNGRIEITLASLQSLVGQVPPPATIESGDVLIVLDARTLRGGELVVP